MKSILFLFLLLLTLFSVSAFAQSYQSDGMDPEMDDEMMSPDIGSQDELLPPESDEISAPGEIERQEDIQYPEGEETSWSLGGEDLPAEEFE